MVLFLWGIPFSGCPLGMRHPTDKYDLDKGLHIKGHAVELDIEYIIERVYDSVFRLGWVTHGVIERPGMVIS